MTADAHSGSTGREGASSFGMVFFALGMAGVPSAPALPGPVLIRLLGDLGMSSAAARSTILRMRRAGWLSSARTGRTVAYSLAPAALAAHNRHRNQFVGSGSEWDGVFHALLVTVPEPERAFRDELRRTASVAGYRTLRSGLLIAPSDRTAELATTLARMPDGASIIPARIGLSEGDTRRVVTELWRLDELAERYRVLAQRAAVATVEARKAPPSGAFAVRAFTEATLPIYEAIGEDPGMPIGLLPAGWPADDLSKALGEALRTFGPAVAEYVRQLGQSRH